MSTALAQAAPTAASTTVWQRYPTIYEIKAWVWLTELSDKYKRPLVLSTVPSTEWDAIASFGFDNFSDTPAQGMVQIPWHDAQHKTWHLIDPISNDLYEPDGYEMLSKGLYVALEPWHYHFFQFVAN